MLFCEQLPFALLSIYLPLAKVITPEQVILLREAQLTHSPCLKSWRYTILPKHAWGNEQARVCSTAEAYSPHILV